MQNKPMPYGDFIPDVHPTAFIAPGAVVAGQVSLAAHVSILFNSVVRGDVHHIEIGEGTNIQDLSMVHVADEWPCSIGREVTVGHSAVIHGCIVHDGVLVGIGAKLLNGCVIGRGSIVAAGAVVPEGMDVPPGMIVAGVPARIKGPVTQQMLEKLGALEDIANSPGIPEDLRGLPGVPFARKYRKVAQAYISGNAYRPNAGLHLD